MIINYHDAPTRGSIRGSIIRRIMLWQYTQAYCTRDYTTALTGVRQAWRARGGHGGVTALGSWILALTNFSTKITAPLWGLTSLDIEHLSI